MKITYEDYKVVRNQIRKLNHQKLIIFIVNKLHELFRVSPEGWRSYTPWEMLLLLKWTFIEFDSSTKTLPIDIKRQNRVINAIKDMNSDVELIKGGMTGLRKYLRRTAFQQFWLQRKLTKAAIGRQAILFEKQVMGFDFQEEFRKLTKISIEEFLMGAFILWAHFCSQKSSVLYLKKKDLNLIKESFVENVLFPILYLWSKQFDEVRSFCAENFSKVDINHQIYEKSPFTEYPLLFLGEEFLCYSPIVFQTKIENYVYDLLKKNRRQEFSQSFGYAFESYVNSLLIESGFSFFNEEQLKKILKKNSKTVDFLVNTDATSLLVESKSVEMHPHAQVSQSSSILESHLEESIVKAVIQMYSSVEDVCQNYPMKKNFGIIVSFKQMYLGNAHMVWEEFLFEAIQKKMNAKDVRIDLLPPQNIFFVSVDEFERIIYFMKRRPELFDQLFDDASAAALTVESKLLFIDYLSKYTDLNENDEEMDDSMHLSLRFDEITKKVIENCMITSVER